MVPYETILSIQQVSFYTSTFYTVLIRTDPLEKKQGTAAIYEFKVLKFSSEQKTG